ncbi:MAG TPA: 3-oxoacyl-[acyl-carrier-protein] synthase III C-terminal domain-containing protein [Candidatus Eisenbacteria bacterium]|nr:3-oxoacyl-[acyl-carrier-protein] synthase III C-terminal domain-containing protein [Candidatus Eisenbacteria bacterium]
MPAASAAPRPRSTTGDPPRLLALATAVPPHVARQGDVKSLATYLFAGMVGADRRLIEVFDHADIATRNVCMPLEWFASDHDFAEKNDLYVEHAVRLGESAVRAALARAGLAPRDVDHLVFVSSTGLATPSVDARLANVLGLRGDVRRTPIWGLGCAGGAAGLARARDFALADPAARVVLVSLEICSLTFQRHDLSKRNLVAASLFGDGAAAAVIAGARAPRPGNGAGAPAPANGDHPLELLASRSTLWPDTLDVMGWTVDGHGLHVVFARDIPTIVNERVRPGLEAFLAEHGLTLQTLAHLVAHPGGVKVLRAYTQALGLPETALRHAREVLRDHGNMSSPTCLFVLERLLADGGVAPGTHAVVAALGPGFSAEYVLLRAAP